MVNKIFLIGPISPILPLTFDFFLLALCVALEVSFFFFEPGIYSVQRVKWKGILLWLSMMSVLVEAIGVHLVVDCWWYVQGWNLLMKFYDLNLV